MDKKIKEIRTALAAATPGKWFSTDDAVRIIPADGEVFVYICQMYEEYESVPDGVAYFPNYENNANFVANAPEYISYLLQQIEIKDKALKEAETFVEELILAADTVPASHLDLEEIAKDGTDVINSIAAALKGEDTSE